MSNFEKMLQESILNPKAQEFIDKAIKKHGDTGYREHDHVFEDKSDMVIPLGSDEHHRPVDMSKIHHSILNTLSKHGYGIHDYVNNVATRTRQMQDGTLREENPKISSILAREKDGEALKHFNDDKQRKSRINKDHEIVISRDPQKVGRMTSSRLWCGEHCTRLPGPELKYPERTTHIEPKDIQDGGLFHHTISEDIKHGTLIAYLVKKGDHNAEAPLGRILLKKHHAVDSLGKPVPGYKPIWRPELYHDFGHSPDNFKGTMKEWAEKNYPALQGKEKSVRYIKEPDLYDDKPETDVSDFVHHAEGVHKRGYTELTFNGKNELHDRKDGTAAKITGRPLSWVREEHHQNGVPHRDGDKPQEKFYQFGEKGRTLTQQIWRQKGFVHRGGDKPAMIMQRHPDSDDKTYTHMAFDLRHRKPENGPAEYSKSASTYYLNGVEHRPASEGPSHVDKYGEFRHTEFGQLVRPPHGGPAAYQPSKVTGSEYKWPATDKEPEVTIPHTRSKLIMEKKDGSIHRFENGVHTKIDEEGISKSPMTDAHHKMYADYMERSHNVPTFKPHNPPAPD